MARDILELPDGAPPIDDDWSPSKINLRAKDADGNNLWLTIQEAAAEARVSVETIYRWMRRRKMARKVLGTTYINRDRLMR